VIDLQEIYPSLYVCDKVCSKTILGLYSGNSIFAWSRCHFRLGSFTKTPLIFVGLVTFSFYF
jgi:hypothetical protein